MRVVCLFVLHATSVGASSWRSRSREFEPAAEHRTCSALSGSSAAALMAASFAASASAPRAWKLKGWLLEARRCRYLQATAQQVSEWIVQAAWRAATPTQQQGVDRERPRSLFMRGCAPGVLLCQQPVVAHLACGRGHRPGSDPGQGHERGGGSSRLSMLMGRGWGGLALPCSSASRTTHVCSAASACARICRSCCSLTEAMLIGRCALPLQAAAPPGYASKASA